MKQFTEQQLMELLIDAAAYGVFYYELNARDSSMGDAVNASDWVKEDLKIRQRLMALVHADAGGYDSKGQEVSRG